MCAGARARWPLQRDQRPGSRHRAQAAKVGGVACACDSQPTHVTAVCGRGGIHSGYEAEVTVGSNTYGCYLTAGDDDAAIEAARIACRSLAASNSPAGSRTGLYAPTVAR